MEQLRYGETHLLNGIMRKCETGGIVTGWVGRVSDVLLNDLQNKALKIMALLFSLAQTVSLIGKY